LRGVLAYVFWHRPDAGVVRVGYDAGLVAFQDAVADVVRAAATFRVSRLPFADGDGYEDWYLVDDWAALGTLNEAAVSGERRLPHDAVAAMAAAGWGGVYALVRGPARPPELARWEDKPRAEGYDGYMDRQLAPAIWQRQMVLGPAPEFCLAEADDTVRRERVLAPAA
jgi:hypothetical protein